MKKSVDSLQLTVDKIFSVVTGQWSPESRLQTQDSRTKTNGQCRMWNQEWTMNTLPWTIMVIVLFLILIASTANSQNNTLVIAHLNEKLPDNGNIIYCSSFQHAWKELADSVLHNEVKLQKPVSLQGNLNRSYKAAAYSPNSIHDSRFTDHGDSIIVTSSFSEQLQWPVEFQSFDHPMRFYQGEDFTRCEYFGIHLREQEELNRYNAQVKIVDFVDEDEFIVKLDARIQTPEARQKTKETGDWKLETGGWGKKEMSLRFIASRTEYGWVEIIIAKVPREKTLLKTVEKVEERINNATYSYRELIPDDILAIPVIKLYTNHSYNELLGKHLANKGFEEYFFTMAEQNINFEMDNVGARAGSDTKIVLKKGPSARRIILDGPFLLYVKEYGANLPYLAVWIDDPQWLVVSD